jgi:predicted nuclease of predicted toxin-antitoxin system
VSEVRYYTDEHVSKAVVRGLRQRGIDVLSVVEANKLGATDEEHLAFAFSERRVMFTQDDDFLRLASLGRAHAGIVYASQDVTVGHAIQGLLLIHRALTAEEIAGNIEFL